MNLEEALKNLAKQSATANNENKTSWQDMITPLLIDHWRPELHAVSVPTKFLPFPMEIAMNWWNSEQIGWSELDANFAKEIDEHLNWQYKFFRLNSRSPKDVMDVCISNSGRDILSKIRSSERMLDDFYQFSKSSLQPVLCFRDVIYGIRPEDEFRVFVKDGIVKAVAAYHVSHYLSPSTITARKENIRQTIEQFVIEKVLPFVEIETLVIDVVFNHNLCGCFLLELNPYGLSDPVGAVNYALIEQGIDDIACGTN